MFGHLRTVIYSPIHEHGFLNLNLCVLCDFVVQSFGLGEQLQDSIV